MLVILIRKAQSIFHQEHQISAYPFLASQILKFYPAPLNHYENQQILEKKILKITLSEFNSLSFSFISSFRISVDNLNF